MGIAPQSRCLKDAGQSGEGRKQFFFEKKAAPALREPKNFCLLGARLRPERGRKSFLLLFFKKEDLSVRWSTLVDERLCTPIPPNH
jgi:hypothetical protein